MAILVTGGAGYIGSHTVVELLNANKDFGEELHKLSNTTTSLFAFNNSTTVCEPI